MGAESAIEITVCNRAREAGWFNRKLKWIGRSGGPDRFFAKDGRVVLIEFKAYGKKPEPLQRMEHERLRAAGVEVHACDSVRQGLRILNVE